MGTETPNPVYDNNTFASRVNYFGIDKPKMGIFDQPLQSVY
jgi:hypothetical protein